MSTRDLRGLRAVVTGSSSGLGAEMARQLSRRGCDLVITARRADRLDALAAELRAAGSDVVCVPLDLVEPDGAARLVDAAYAGGRDVDILVNNAGVGIYQPFATVDWEQYEAVVDLNVRAVTELTSRFIARMRARDRPSYVGNVASVLSFIQTPRFAVYAATKSYVRSFTSTLARELRGTRVSVTCICFGAIDTPFNPTAGLPISRLYRPFVMRPERAVRIGLRGLLRRRRLVVPGVLNNLVRASTWVVPAPIVAAVVGYVMGPPQAALPAGRDPGADP
jgi:uncharacterized protein